VEASEYPVGLCERGWVAVWGGINLQVIVERTNDDRGAPPALEGGQRSSGLGKGIPWWNFPVLSGIICQGCYQRQKPADVPENKNSHSDGGGI
jgi:hypothetical protein